MKKLITALSGLLVFFIFAVFSYLVKKKLFGSFDFDTTVRIQDHVSDKLSEFFSYFSLLGSAEITTLILIVIIFLPRDLLRKLAFLPTYFFVFLLGLLGKIFISHPGPPFIFYHYKLGFLFPSTYVQTGNSYPSGHSARTTFLSVVLIILILQSGKMTPLKLLLIIVVLAFEGTMLVSRVYLGEHWTSDVIGGALLGASFGILGSTFLLKKEKTISSQQ